MIPEIVRRSWVDLTGVSLKTVQVTLRVRRFKFKYTCRTYSLWVHHLRWKREGLLNSLPEEVIVLSLTPRLERSDRVSCRPLKVRKVVTHPFRVQSASSDPVSCPRSLRDSRRPVREPGMSFGFLSLRDPWRFLGSSSNVSLVQFHYSRPHVHPTLTSSWPTPYSLCPRSTTLVTQSNMRRKMKTRTSFKK